MTRSKALKARKRPQFYAAQHRNVLNAKFISDFLGEILFFTKSFSIFALTSCRDDNANYSLVKSSLVFVLVNGGSVETESPLIFD